VDSRRRTTRRWPCASAGADDPDVRAHFTTRTRAGKNCCSKARRTLLDIGHGTYPFVTSSNCVGRRRRGAGVGPQMLHYVLGITKAYTTRSARGRFRPTGRLYRRSLRTRGKEFGSVPAPRRCGWFDAAALKRSVQINGVSGLC